MIRKATISDARPIHALLQDFAKEGELLGRPLSELYDHIRDFSVCEDEKTGEIAACCGLHVCWEDLAEIRSLAVRRDRWNQGIGSRLMLFSLSEAKALGITRLFALTYRPWFFEKHGFTVKDKKNLPQKIWSDCVKCVKFPDCDEIAVMRLLEP